MRVVIDCNVLVSAARTRNFCEGIGDYNPLWHDHRAPELSL